MPHALVPNSKIIHESEIFHGHSSLIYCFSTVAHSYLEMMTQV